MSVALGLGLGFFVLTAVGSVLGISLVSGYQNTSELLRQKAELLVSAQVDQVSQQFNAAQNQVDFIVEQIVNGETEPGLSEEFTALMMGALAATPQIIRIQYADVGYRLFGAERLDGETLPIFRAVGNDQDMRQLLHRARMSEAPFWGKLLWRQEVVGWDNRSSSFWPRSSDHFDHFGKHQSGIYMPQGPEFIRCDYPNPLPVRNTNRQRSITTTLWFETTNFSVLFPSSCRRRDCRNSLVT